LDSLEKSLGFAMTDPLLVPSPRRVHLVAGVALRQGRQQADGPETFAREECDWATGRSKQRGAYWPRDYGAQTEAKRRHKLRPG
jgi:hypothetical protein